MEKAQNNLTTKHRENAEKLEVWVNCDHVISSEHVMQLQCECNSWKELKLYSIGTVKSHV